MHYLLSTWTKIKIGKISVRAVAWTACPLLRIEFFPNSYFLVWKLFLGFVFLRFAILSLSTSSFDIDQRNLMAPFSVGLTRGKKQSECECESDFLQLVFIDLISIYHFVLLPETHEGSKNSVRPIAWTAHALEWIRFIPHFVIIYNENFRTL